MNNLNGDGASKYVIDFVKYKPLYEKKGHHHDVIEIIKNKLTVLGRDNPECFSWIDLTYPHGNEIFTTEVLYPLQQSGVLHRFQFTPLLTNFQNHFFTLPRPIFLSASIVSDLGRSILQLPMTNIENRWQEFWYQSRDNVKNGIQESEFQSKFVKCIKDFLIQVRRRAQNMKYTDVLYVPIGNKLFYSHTIIIGLYFNTRENLSFVLHNILMIIDFIYMQALEKCTIESALKSAISTIMSRNGSHNIGSHVLAALSHNVGTMPDDRILYQYIQHRMDYMATVASDFPTWKQPTMFVGELMREFFSQRHLLDHIAESEGLSAWEFQNPDLSAEEAREQHGKIKIRIRHDKGDGKTLVDVIDYTKEAAIKSLLKEDVALAIPGGVVGNHAFFTILENIIRNAAKHGWSKRLPEERKQSNLEVTIDYKDSGRYVQFTIWDNMSNVDSKDTTSTSKPEKTLLERQKDRINQPFIDEEGRLRRENWGMAEIKISAGYLTGQEIGKIGGLDEPAGASIILEHYGNGLDIGEKGGLEQQNKDLIVEPCPVEDDNDKDVKRLGYCFLIEKPCDVVFVLDTAQEDQRNLWNTVNDKNGIAKFQVLGIDFMTREAAEKALNDNGSSAKKKLFAARYVILPKFENEERWGPWPFRVLTWKEPYICKDLVGVLSLEAVKTVVSGNHDADIRAIREVVETAWLRQLMKQFESVSMEKMKQFESVSMEKSAVAFVKKGEFALVINPEADSSGGRGLITNADVLKFVFTHGLRTAIETFLEVKYGQLSEDTIIVLWALHALPPPKQPLNYADNDDVAATIAWEMLARVSPLFDCEFLQKCNKRFVDSGNRLLERLQWKCPELIQNCPQRWSDSSERCLELLKPVRIYLECRYRPKKEYIKNHTEIFPTWNDSPNNAENYKSKFEASPHEIAGFVRHLQNAFSEADVFLRKYEERITTLPSGLSCSVRTNIAGGQSGCRLCGIECRTQSCSDNSKVEAVYYRHFEPKSENNPSWKIYQEPLSGAQSYFNAIAGMTQNSGGQGDYDVWVAKMVECALLKICVADERVAKFLRDHSAVRNTYGVENILVLDDKWVEERLGYQASDLASQQSPSSQAKSPSDVKSPIPRDKETGLYQPNVELLQEVHEYISNLSEVPMDTPSADWVEKRVEQWKNDLRKKKGTDYTDYRTVVASYFDILILHQGLIDKWLGETSHSKGHVAVFLGILKLYVKYVVITTGRGTPANIPPGARVLPFPTLESTLFKMYPEKLVLVDTIMNILPVGK